MTTTTATRPRKRKQAEQPQPQQEPQLQQPQPAEENPPPQQPIRQPGIPVFTLAEMAAAQFRGHGGKGLECPQCGCRDLRVYKTRHVSEEIDRRRICRNCGFRVTTMEIIP